jgi:hypothetical protein
MLIRGRCRSSLRSVTNENGPRCFARAGLDGGGVCGLSVTHLLARGLDSLRLHLASAASDESGAAFALYSQYSYRQNRQRLVDGQSQGPGQIMSEQTDDGKGDMVGPADANPLSERLPFGNIKPDRQQFHPLQRYGGPRLDREFPHSGDSGDFHDHKL